MNVCHEFSLFATMHLRRILILFLCVGVTQLHAQTIINSGFEEDAHSSSQKGWITDCKGTGQIKFSNISPHSGKQCLEIAHQNQATCTFSQSISIKDSEIKNYKIIYSCRAEALNGNTGLNIIIRDASGKKLTESSGFIKNAEAKWKTYSIATSVPEGAQTMSITGILNGTGNVWFDEIKIEELKQHKSSSGLWSTASEFMTIAGKYSIGEAIKWAVEKK